MTPRSVRCKPRPVPSLILESARQSRRAPRRLLRAGHRDSADGVQASEALQRIDRFGRTTAEERSSHHGGSILGSHRRSGGGHRRVLAADAVEKVGNGHPGTAMSLAPAAYLLYQKVMRRDPADTQWVGRDRFILSGRSQVADPVRPAVPRRVRAGARRPARRCAPGARRLRVTPSTVTPTASRSPPGRSARASPPPSGSPTPPATSAACSIRMPRRAAPVRPLHLRHRQRRRPEEGVTSEASSLAGHQELGNLVVIYDSNQISIEDDTNIAFTEDVARPLRGIRLARPGGRLEEDRRVRGRRPRAERGHRGGQGRVTDKPSMIMLRRSSAGRRPGSRTPARSTAPPSAPRRSPPSRRCSASTRSRPSW